MFLKRFWLLVLCVIGTSLFATVTIKDVKAVPRWPWNGLVDITYSVECDEKDDDGNPYQVYVMFKGYDNVHNKELEMKTLSGDSVGGFLTSSGSYHTVWNAGTDVPNTILTSLTVKMAGMVNPDYLVVDLSNGSDATSYSYRYTSTAPDVTQDTCRTTELWLRRIPAGTFTMGSPENEVGRIKSIDEPQHQVTLTQAFYIGVFEVTQKQYELVMGSNPSYYTGDCRPVEGVSYDTIRGTGAEAGAGWPAYGHTVDEDSFMGRLQKRTGLTFDLPTESQWEYACRKKADGTCCTTALNSDENLTSIDQDSAMDKVGRYKYNRSDGKGGYTAHTKVGSYQPSELGLYDMHGNVCEWCLDRYGTYPGTTTDSVGASSGSYRVWRGGGWSLNAHFCRSAFRYMSYPGQHDLVIGFRVACLPKDVKNFTMTYTLAPSTAKWSVNGNEYASGENAVLAEGTYTVTFSDVDGYVTPDSQTVTVSSNVTQSVEYVAESEALYLVVDLSNGSDATSYSYRYTATAPDVTQDTCRTTELWLRRIPAGTFTMGSPENEVGRENNETQHQVTLTQDFYIGVFEVTQKQYELVMGSNPSYGHGDCRPVEGVSYDTIRGTGAEAGAGWPAYGHTVDEDSFMGRLQKRTGLTFDLPTESQWEYACRKKADGTCCTTALNSDENPTTTDQDSAMDKVGRYKFNRNDGKGGYTEHTKVGSYQPSELGLYDMHGNVRELCLDWYGSYPGTTTDPVGAASGSYRVIRGGDWYLDATSCRAAKRIVSSPSTIWRLNGGFRVACLPKDVKNYTMTYTLTSSTAKWSVNGNEYASGENAVLAEGTYTVTFSDVDGYVTPNSQTVTVSSNVTQSVEYVAESEALYLVVDLSNGSDATSYSYRYTATAPDVTQDTCRTTELWLRRIPAGTFTMGSPENEVGRYSGETQHQVTLTQDFYIGVFEVTQKQYQLVMGSNPSTYKGDCRPVESVSYDTIRGTGAEAGAGWPTYGHTVDDDTFMGRLQKRTGLTFDLPTESQWEYACRKKADGTCCTTALNSGENLTSTDQDSAMDKVGRYDYNKSDGKGGYSQYSDHTKVGSYQPSELGLYDMHGNVWEWCLDWHGTYPETTTDPVGAASGSRRVRRGGSYSNPASSCRAACRDQYGNPSNSGVNIFGFRVACLPVR